MKKKIQRKNKETLMNFLSVGSNFVKIMRFSRRAFKWSKAEDFLRNMVSVCDEELRFVGAVTCGVTLNWRFGIILNSIMK